MIATVRWHLATGVLPEEFVNGVFGVGDDEGLPLGDDGEVLGIEAYPQHDDEPNAFLLNEEHNRQLRRGAVVTIAGLQDTALNGKLGRVERFDNARGRYLIRIKDRTKPLGLRPDNCTLCEVVLTVKSHEDITLSCNGFVASLTGGPEGPRLTDDRKVIPHIARSDVVMSGGKHFAQFRMLPDTISEAVSFGVMRPNSMDLGETNPSECSCFYFTGDGDLHFPPRQRCDTPPWDGMQPAAPGDRIALLLDQDCGSITVFKNDKRLGVMTKGLSGNYCWAIMMNRKGTSVRIKSMSLISARV